MGTSQSQKPSLRPIGGYSQSESCAPPCPPCRSKGMGSSQSQTPSLWPIVGCSQSQSCASPHSPCKAMRADIKRFEESDLFLIGRSPKHSKRNDKKAQHLEVAIAERRNLAPSLKHWEEELQELCRWEKRRERKNWEQELLALQKSQKGWCKKC